MRTLPIQNRQRRTGFTLVELIVVITIVVVLLAITASAVNFSFEAEKVGGAARQVQSYLSGARDRAIHAGAPRGVRFVRTTDASGASSASFAADPADPNRRTINSLMFIAPSEPWTEGRIQMERRLAADPAFPGSYDYLLPLDPTVANVVAAQPTSGWFELAARQSLHKGLRIRIPNDRSGSWYTIIDFLDLSKWPATAQNLNGDLGFATVPPTFDPLDGDTTNDDPFPLKLLIAPAYRDPADRPIGPASTPFEAAYREIHPNTYNLELPHVILPERPVLLPKGTVIDLDGSDVPFSWQLLNDPTATLGQTSVVGSAQPAFFDVMFSPRGTVIGDAASKGILHFYVTGQDSVELFRNYLVTDVLPNTTPSYPIIPANEVLFDGVVESVGDRALVSVFTRTGAVSAHPIDVTDNNENADVNGNGSVELGVADGIADDPYRFAETGEVLDQ